MKLTTNLKILIVEDDLDTRNLIKVILRKLGFKNLHSTSDGEEAVEYMKKSYMEDKPVGLVLADWNMPKLDGISFLRKLRNSSDFKRIPFLMVTADSDRAHVVEAINEGVSGYLIKPITPDVLKEKIVKVIQNAD
jgi:two-component system chemotaxis response regulator CheY